METIEIVKAELSGILETAGESGVTEGQAVAAVVKHGIDYHTALDSLRKVYQEVGAERTPAHSGTVIVYRKLKKEPEKQETPAIKIARKAVQSSTNERKMAAILDSYRR